MKIARFSFSLFGINTYVVWDPESRECAVIDPGMTDSREQGALTSFIDQENLKVTHVINTHLHIDHAAGDEFTRKRFGAPLLAHKGDEVLGLRLESQAQMFGLSGDFHDIDISSYIEDGDIISVGQGKLQVIHVPGHSPGSVALYDNDGGFIVAGDIIFNGSIGRTDLPGGNSRQLVEGIHKKIFTLPVSTIIYPGHGPATTVGEEIRSNPFFN